MYYNIYLNIISNNINRICIQNNTTIIIYIILNFRWYSRYGLSVPLFHDFLGFYELFFSHRSRHKGDNHLITAAAISISAVFSVLTTGSYRAYLPTCRVGPLHDIILLYSTTNTHIMCNNNNIFMDTRMLKRTIIRI